MVVYTVQMAKWRLCKEKGIRLIDTTVKTGDPVFAPTWDIVMGVKKGSLTEAEYTEVYRDLMQHSYDTERHQWASLCLSDEPIAIACYCKSGKFCHRHLLLRYFEKICNHHHIPFVYKGEIE